MADPFATVDDLKSGWLGFPEGEEALAGVLLARASRLIRAEVPDVDAQIQDGKLDQELVGDVVCAMVKRAMLNEDTAGVSNTQETTGPFSQTFTFANPSGDLYLLKSERSRLLGGVQRAFSIDLLGGSDAG